MEEGVKRNHDEGQQHDDAPKKKFKEIQVVPPKQRDAVNTVLAFLQQHKVDDDALCSDLRWLSKQPRFQPAHDHLVKVSYGFFWSTVIPLSYYLVVRNLVYDSDKPWSWYFYVNERGTSADVTEFSVTWACEELTNDDGDDGEASWNVLQSINLRAYYGELYLSRFLTQVKATLNQLPLFTPDDNSCDSPTAMMRHFDFPKIRKDVLESIPARTSVIFPELLRTAAKGNVECQVMFSSPWEAALFILLQPDVCIESYDNVRRTHSTRRERNRVTIHNSVIHQPWYSDEVLWDRSVLIDQLDEWFSNDRRSNGYIIFYINAVKKFLSRPAVCMLGLQKYRRSPLISKYIPRDVMKIIVKMMTLK